MTEPPTESEAPAVEAPAPEPKHRVSRGRSIAARILVILGIVFLVISLLSNFVKREALDKDNFRSTSEQLIANDEIRNQVAAAMVETLYANVDVSAQLKDQLPKNLQGLSGPIAGIARDAADRGARAGTRPSQGAAALRRPGGRRRSRSSSRCSRTRRRCSTRRTGTSCSTSGRS